MPGGRLRRLGRRLALTGLALAGVFALTLWLLRDQPRRLVERIIATELGATAELGRLEIDGHRNFVLHDLRVILQNDPWTVDALIPRLSVQGSLSEIRVGRFELLGVRGGEIKITLAPTSLESTQTRDPEDELQRLFIGRLRVHAARLMLENDGNVSVFTVDADVQDFGGFASGELRVRGVDQALMPLLEFVLEPDDVEILEAQIGLQLETTCPSLTAELRFPGDGSALLETGGTCPLQLRDSPKRWIEFPSAKLRVTFPDNSDLARLTLHAELPDRMTLVASGHGSLSSQKIDWTAVDATIGDLATMLQVGGVAVDGVELEGNATIEARADSAGHWTVQGTADGRSLVWAEGNKRIELSDPQLRVDLRGAVPDETSQSPWQVSGSLSVRSLDGALGPDSSPISLGPLSVEIDATATPGSPASILGVMRVHVDPIDDIVIDVEARYGTQEQLLVDTRIKLEDVALAELRELAENLGVDGESWPAMTGRSTIEIHAEGPISAPVLTADFGIRDARIESLVDDGEDPLVLDNATLDLHAVSTPEGEFQLHLVRLLGEIAFPGLPQLSVRVHGEGRLLEDGQVSVSSASVSLADLLTARITDGRFNLDDGSGAASVRVDETDLAPILRSIDGLPEPDEFEIAAKASTDLRIAWDSASAWVAEGTFRSDGVQVTSDDFSREGQGLRTTARFRLTGVGGSISTGRLDADLGGFELLWGAVYGDWNSVAPEVSVGYERLDESTGQAWRLRGEVRFDPGTRLEATVEGSGQGSGFEGTFHADNLTDAFTRYVRRPLAGSYPRVSESSLAGACSVTAQGFLDADSVRVAGTLHLAEVDWSVPDPGLGIQGLNLHLPFDLSTVDRGVTYAGPLLRGELGFRRIDLFGVEVPAVESGIEVEGDSLGLVESISVPILGGTAGLSELVIESLLRPGAYARSALSVQGLRLEEISSLFGLPLLEGQLAGSFPDVRVSRTELEVQGGGALEIFGGTVEFSGISGRNIFGDYPELAFSAEFREIDLARITHRFDVGEMSGIAQGYVKDCELFAGAPSRFDALFETTRRKGVKRSINVKAINNLTILGTGSSVGILDRGIHRLFDHYTYDKLGIRARLADDAFLLTGTEHRGDRELFLKGQLPLRIDIVNVNSGRAVSFRGMLQRLQSVDVGLAETGER